MSILQNRISLPGLHTQPQVRTWWGHLLWVLGAGLLGWAIAAFFAGILLWSRSLFLVPYVLLTTLYIVAWLRWGEFDWRNHLVQNWGWGLVSALVVGAFVVFSVLRQARTPMPQGTDLLFSLLWLGLAYGLIDGLLLSVLPVVATRQACQRLGWTEGRSGKIVSGGLALLTSLLVTVTYHLGYPEFQGVAVFLPMIAVGLMSVAYLLSRNPLAPMLSHIAMHMAAVLYGLQTAVQLPPHY